MNNLNNPTYQRLRDLILKSEGRKTKVEFGDYFSGNGLSNARVLQVVENHPAFWALRYWNTGLNEAGYIEIENEKIEFHDYKEITLDRVLMALGEMEAKIVSVSLLSSEDKGWSQGFNFRFDVDGFGNEIKWILGQPLHLQTPETWESLIKILS